ncbi:VOC family protein [Candidatus Saccharibacteria bacterium]|nr:VOC family protein [Candidatus Saccharibacteria bacterium]
MAYKADLVTAIGDYEGFLDDILDRVQFEGFDFDDFVQADHICYRTIDEESYQLKRFQLHKVGKLLGETMVSGRPISTFRLTEPIDFEGWRIDAIELPAPKPNSGYTEGLEHIEFVLYDDFETFLNKYPNRPYDKKSMERGINPELGLKLGEYAVKFHLLSLTTVVYLEKVLGIEKV